MLHSFFFAGFECAMGINAYGEPFDQIEATGHAAQAVSDYRLLREAGIQTVRDGVRWPLVDRAGWLSFDSLEPMLVAAEVNRMEVIWDLFHYGYPSDLDPFSADFAERFAAYCHATALVVRARTSPPWYFTPVNEPSYFAWAAGDQALFAPHRRGCSRELKVALIRAAIRGIDAIRAACPEARIVNIDPVCWTVPPPDRPDLAEAAAAFNDHVVYEAFDMLSGRVRPELGGSLDHLGIVGLNYYAANQWQFGRPEQPLLESDPRRRPLEDLVGDAWRRYGRKVVITETSQHGEARAPWIEHLSASLEALQDAGVPIHGACLYPVLGMPEWHARDRWVRMGLWDVADGCGSERRPHAAALRALQRAQARQRRRTPPERRVLTPLVDTASA